MPEKSMSEQKSKVQPQIPKELDDDKLFESMISSVISSYI